MKKSTPSILLPFLAVFILISSSACSFKKDDSNDKKEQTTTAEDVANELERIKQEGLKKQTISLKDFVFSIQERKAPNQYSVKIDYPTVEGVVVYISLGNPIPNSYSGMTLDAEGGSSLNFVIAAYNSAGVLILNANKKLDIPLDLVVSELYPLNQDTTLKLGRLYLNDESILKTNGFLLSVEANQIFARPNSKIINFTPGEVWTENRQKSGGSISLRAKQASGFLTISLNGANGKNGRSGSELVYLKALPPARDGFDGDDGDYDADSDCSEDYAGNPRCGIINIRCSKQPTNGEDGDPGADGIKGENGLNGGDSGNLFVQVEDDTSFAVRVSAKAGQGGLGGQGSPGLPGGKGGAPGALDKQNKCTPASKGKDGEPGKPGKTGDNGQPGIVGTVELNGLKNALIEK